MDSYKFSFYNLVFGFGGKYYIYNTLSTALAELDKETFCLVQNNDIASLKPQYLEAMKEQHFIASKDAEEANEYLYYYNRTRFGKSSKTLSLNFIPTYNCNLACPYCLQGTNKENKRISLPDIDKIILFAEKTVTNSRENDVPVTRLYPHLFGGEPLLCKDATIYFTDALSQIAQKNHCEIFWSMTSNLTLLDDEFIAFIKKYKISTQVSIDGTKEQHDKRRFFKNGKGTYDIIINNLERLNSAGLKDYIVLRLNIDKNNLEDAEEIMQNVRNYSNDIYFGFLDTFVGYNDSFAQNCLSNEIYPEIVCGKFSAIYKKYNLPQAKSFGKMAPCSLCCENKFFIDCYLNVYKCEMLLNQPAASAGKINADGALVVNNGFYRQMSHTPANFPECLDCKLLPLCAGGCAGKAYVAAAKNDGKLDKKNCMFTESSLITYLTNYIKSLT